MASSNKRKTTMAKLNRERRLVERRQEKAARKAARQQAAAEDSTKPLANQPAVDAAAEAFGEMARTDAQKPEQS